jgi:hypothetical protein
MTLVFDNRQKLQGEKGLHALIVGVSHYPHLPGGGGTPATNNYGMQQLSSTALSAFKMYRWLMDNKDNLSVPLATCRLLLSPSAGESMSEPALVGLADPATRQNFTAEARSWREDARTHEDNVTIFYFAGHGVQRSKTDGVLLLNDFGDPQQGTLTNTADIINIFNGMAPPDNSGQPVELKMARTQFYFVDACRVLPSAFKNFEKMSVPDVFDVELSGRDDRYAPIFYATVPGIKAYARKNKQTLFFEALLQCLEGAAGAPVGHDDDSDNTVEWHVTAQSLNKALASYFGELTNLPGTEQEFSLGGIPTGDPTLIRLAKPPLVDVFLEVDPQDALQYTKFKMVDDKGQPVAELVAPGGGQLQDLPHPLNPHPYQFRVAAGIYKIDALIDPPHPNYSNREGRSRMMLPPRFPVKRRVIP